MKQLNNLILNTRSILKYNGIMIHPTLNILIISLNGHGSYRHLLKNF